MKLEELREHIDQIDDKIFDLLRERLDLVGQVGKLKKSGSSRQYIIRPGREALKVKKAFQQAKEARFDSKISMAIASIWREIISLSINFEEEVHIAYNSKKSKETLWLLREYFGPYSEMQEYSLDKEIIKSLLNKSRNVGAFTVERKAGFEPWWLELAKYPELSVFASLPVFPLKNMAENSGLGYFLVSNVTPEPCGEDKFYYVLTQQLPEEDRDTFEIISEYKGNYLIASDEFYNNYQSKLNGKYLGCCAVFGFD